MTALPRVQAESLHEEALKRTGGSCRLETTFVVVIYGELDS